MQIIGGVRQTAPTWKEVSFAPVFHGDHGGATIPTPRGTIRSAWNRTSTGIEVNLELPRGIAAMASLPGIPRHRVTGQRRWLIPSNKE